MRAKAKVPLSGDFALCRSNMSRLGSEKKLDIQWIQRLKASGVQNLHLYKYKKNPLTVAKIRRHTLLFVALLARCVFFVARPRTTSTLNDDTPRTPMHRDGVSSLSARSLFSRSLSNATF